MKNVWEYFRVKEWYASKIPLAMAAFLHCCLLQKPELPNRDFIVLYTGFFVFFISYFAFNYLLNDFFDMEIDRLANKKKVILSVPAPVVAASLGGLALAGNLALWIAVNFDTQVMIMSVIVYLLGASYSVKGLRMKEKGIWGLIVSSFAQRNSPVLILAVMMPMDRIFFWCWMVISFVNGLRYILIHQYIDQENDRRSNVHTFVADHMNSISTAIQVSIGLETAVLVFLFFDVWKEPVSWVFVFLYLVLLWLNGNFVEKVLHESFFYSFANVPLEDLYNVYLPLILTACYVKQSGLFLLGIFTVVYLWVPFRKKIEMPVMAVRMKLEKK